MRFVHESTRLRGFLALAFTDRHGLNDFSRRRITGVKRGFEFTPDEAVAIAFGGGECDRGR